MNNTKIISLKSLLKPINKKFPTGEDLRLSEKNKDLYLNIRDSRQKARTLERQTDQGIESSGSPDWSCVYDQAIFLLSTKTKDIEISTWLCEALIRLYGFSGLKEGFYLIKYYIKNYWELLYPMPDEEGVYNRIAALAGLNGNDTDGTLIIPIAKVELTESKLSGPFALWHFQQARAGSPSMEMIENTAAKTSSEFYQKLLKDLQDCINIFESLDHILTDKCGNHSPPTSRISGKLKECLNAAQNLSQKSMIPIIPDVQNRDSEITISGFTDRENMLNTILQAAQFFRQTEPHSPLPYLLERAVRWGKTPLPKLWREMVQDDQSWSHLCNLTGIEVQSQ